MELYLGFWYWLKYTVIILEKINVAATLPPNGVCHIHKKKIKFKYYRLSHMTAGV